MKHLLIFTTFFLLTQISCATPASAAGKVLFEDNFQGHLADGWNWIREHSDHWCVRDGALDIRVVPGRADTVKNALIRPAPSRSEAPYAIDLTVTNLSPPTEQWEQAGITWYQNGKPVFKLVKELVDGQVMIIPGRKPIDSKTAQLRLILTADSYTAMFREEGRGEFKVAATGELPPAEQEQVSIQCYNGPPDAEHWIQFDHFRITKLADAANAQDGKSDNPSDD